MKKISFLTLLAVPLIFCACDFKNLTTPKEVEVVTGATYEFSLAKLDSKKQEWLDFSKFIDMEKMVSSDSSSSSGNSFTLYKYNDGSEYQQLLMHMPLQKVDINLSEQFKDMDVTKQMESFNVHEDIEIPKLNNPDPPKDLSLDSIQTAINNGITIGGIPGEDLDVTFVGDGLFTSVKYTSGYFAVSTEGASGTVQLKNSSGGIVSSGEFNDEHVALLNIAGKTITSSGMKLNFTNVTDNTHTIPFGATIVDGVIEIATGVTLTQGTDFTIQPVTTSFENNMSDNIKECTVNNGSLKITISNPTSWSDGVIHDYTVTTSGGLEVTVTKTGSTTGNLNNKTLKPQKIDAVADVEIVLNDATIDFTDPPQVTVTVDIQTITAKVLLPDSYETEVDKTESLSDLANYVSSITLAPSGFDVTVTNTLPAGNPITMGITSEFFGLDASQAEGTKTFPSGSTDVKKEYRGPVKTNPVAADSEVLVLADLGLPGYEKNGTERTITVSNVVPDTTYVLDIKVDPVFVWTEAQVHLSDSDATAKADKILSGMSKADLFKAFGESFANENADKIEFEAMPMYLFADMPENIEAFKDAKFAGTIKAYYGKENPTPAPDGSDKILKVTGSPEANLLTKPIKPGKMPALTKNAEGFVTAELKGDALPFEDAFNLVPPANADGASICIDYNIHLDDGTDATITPADLEGGDTTITMDIVLLLTFKFRVLDDIDLRLLEMMNKSDSSSAATKTDKEKDLFHRDQATSAGNIKKYLDVVKSAELEFNDPKFPFKSSGGMALKIDWKNGGGPTSYKLKDGEKTVVEVKPSILMETYPLEPDIAIVIHPGSFGLPREMPMEASLKLRVKAEGPIKVFPFDEEEAN